jgi:N-acetylglutamate synthase-like GNAT family acetyltransferase
MEMLVVHPAYWHRGHGTRLVRWGMKLADIDKVKQGVIAATIGSEFCASLGWKKLEDLTIEGDDITPQGLNIQIMDYEPHSSQESSEL